MGKGETTNLNYDATFWETREITNSEPREFSEPNREKLNNSAVKRSKDRSGRFLSKQRKGQVTAPADRITHPKATSKDLRYLLLQM